jgi:hypothetical protein
MLGPDEQYNDLENVDRDFIPPVFTAYAHPWDRWEDTNRPAGVEIYENRLNLCKQCPFYASETCSKCGCHMPSKAKMLNATCPVSKW